MARVLMERKELLENNCTLARERDEARRVARDALADRDHMLGTICDLRVEASSWRRRCEALYDIADPDLRDGVLGTITTIEGLPCIDDGGVA